MPNNRCSAHFSDSLCYLTDFEDVVSWHQRYTPFKEVEFSSSMFIFTASNASSFPGYNIILWKMICVSMAKAMS